MTSFGKIEKESENVENDQDHHTAHSNILGSELFKSAMIGSTKELCF
ncbi:MAG: hypothetical protein ACJAS3_003103 [Roseivirga sp.]